MAAPVWVLSVDLQTKTATFQTGMSDAVKTARGAFGDIKEGAREMSGEMGRSITEARHGVMMLGEEFDIHLPRGLTTFIARLGPVGPAMEAAFPFLAIALGAKILFEHLEKIGHASEKLAADQEKFQTTVSNTFGALDMKLLQAGIRADELSGNHLAALKKQLEMIDRQSMADLVKSLEEVAKAADSVFGDLSTHFWQFSGPGSEGAKHALDEFKGKYDSLLAQGKEGEAADLLAGTLKSAQRVLQAQQQIINDQRHMADTGNPLEDNETPRFRAALADLQQQRIGYTEKEIQAQQALVDTLRAQVGVQERINNLKTLEKGNAVKTEGQRGEDEAFKTLIAQAENERRIAEQEQKDQEERYRQAVARLQENEKEKIDATDRGSAARLAAIDAAIKEENTRGLQETQFYKGLLTQRVETVRQITQEETKLRADAAKEAADHALKMGELQLAADKQLAQSQLAIARGSLRDSLDSDIEFANRDYALKMTALSQQIAALDKSGKDYENRLKAIQDRQAELTKAHENEITQIKLKAEEERTSKILTAERRLDDEIARNMTSVLMRQQSFGRMLVSIGNQVVSGMIQNAIQSMLADDMTKERDAAAAARKAFLAGMHFPFPVNLVMAPTLAAGAFASVMAFESGGIVPGVGRGDVVPAMLTPGETVIPRQMTERLSRAASDDDSQRRGDIHVHVHHAPTIHALDATGMERVLRKNAHVLTQHVQNELRKMNK